MCLFSKETDDDAAVDQRLLEVILQLESTYSHRAHDLPATTVPIIIGLLAKAFKDLLNITTIVANMKTGVKKHYKPSSKFKLNSKVGLTS